MFHRYQGKRYRDAASPDLVAFAESGDLHSLDFDGIIKFYTDMGAVGSNADLAYLGAVDRYFLLTYLLDRTDAFHPWLYDRCREVEAEPDGFLDLWSREHYKSTLITYAGAIQEIINEPEITIGIFSHTKGIASKFVAQIKREFEINHEIRTVYAELCWLRPKGEAPVWSEQAFTVRRRSNPKEATVEGHGVVGGQPTSKHFDLIIYDDLVTLESVSTPEQVQKTTQAWELSTNLGAKDGRRWMIGTRYCTRGDQRVLMADWTHKPIADIRIGDEVVGWEKRDGKRYLRKAKVINRGVHFDQPVYRYMMEHGRSVVCTADHKWWRGPHGGGPEYAPLGLAPHVRKDRVHRGKKFNGHLVALRELLVPAKRDEGRDAGWLAGFFDGEGTMALNTGKNRASGRPCIVQTMANPELIDKVREVLTRLGFAWSEGWHAPSKVKAAASKPDHNQAHWKDRCVFGISGGWTERYRFMAQIAPTKNARLSASLFAQLSTERRALTTIESEGTADVHWLETETGNYVVEGFCSSNSFGDSYATLLGNNVVKPRIYAATENGRLDGPPVFLTPAIWEKKKREQGSTVAAQMLQNPLSGKERMFHPQWFRPWFVRPAKLNVYIMADPSRGRTAKSDRTAMAVIGIDANSNKYWLDGFRHRMTLSQRWDHLKHLHKKWVGMAGINYVKVGYERYGQQSDDEYFQERMAQEKYSFSIEELAWPREGDQSKKARVERLQPDIQHGAFFFPGVVYSGGKRCTWAADMDKGQMVYEPLEDETKAMKAARERGQPELVAVALTRKSEDQKVYDLTADLMEELLYFPFGTHDDLCDAASRIYDMEPVEASTRDEVPELPATVD